MEHFVIIGGTAGIGRRLAERLAGEGMKVTIAGRDARRAADVADEIAADAVEGADVMGLKADLSRPDSLAESLGRIDALDHLVLAGVNRDSNTIKAFNIPGALELATVKVVGYAAAVASLAPKIREHGSVLLFGGVAKDAPYPGSTVVTSVNGAMVGMVRTLAHELAPLRVNAVHPGMVGDSPYWVANQAMVCLARARILTDRVPTMDDIVDGCCFLMRNRAANGINLNLDGGIRV